MPIDHVIYHRASIFLCILLSTPLATSSSSVYATFTSSLHKYTSAGVYSWKSLEIKREGERAPYNILLDQTNLYFKYTPMNSESGLALLLCLINKQFLLFDYQLSLFVFVHLGE